MKIAITGITGFIGKSLALKLLQQGNEVSGLVHSPEKARSLPASIKKVYGNIHNKVVLKQTFESCDLIYHCAAVVNGGKKEMMDINVRGTEAVCSVAEEMNIKRMIYLSSIAVISGNDGPYPLNEELPYAAYNDYGISKIESEKVVRDFIKKGLNAAIIRPSAVYGPGEPHVLSKILRLSKAGLLPLVGKGLVQWQLIHIDDLTDFLISIINNDRAYNDVFNVSSDETIEMIELYKLIKTFTHRGAIISIPLWLIMPVARITDIPFNLKGKRPFTNKVKFFERHHTYDTSKARNILGLKTKITLEQGLAQIYGSAPVQHA
jgi:nucleoside-diphosphate-sugar epimerase